MATLNYKGLLQEHLQRVDSTAPLPSYLVRQDGGARFVSHVRVNDHVYMGRPGFARKKEAMQDAARVALEQQQPEQPEQQQQQPEQQQQQQQPEQPLWTGACVFVDVDHMHKEWQRLVALARRPDYGALVLEGCAGMSCPVCEESSVPNATMWKAWTLRANMADTMLAYRAFAASRSLPSDVPFYFLSKDAAVENIALVLQRTEPERRVELFTDIRPLLATLLQQ